MSTNLIDGIAYVALVINLYSMSTKGEFKLRLISLVANVCYIFYGALINASPIVIGAAIAVFLHAYHLHRIQAQKTRND